MWYSLYLLLRLIMVQVYEFFWDKRLNYSVELKKTLKDFNSIVETSVSRHTEDIGTLFRKNNKLNKKFSIDNRNGIIDFDVENKKIIVGSRTRFSDILSETLPYGLMPKSVPELSSITVGGAISGISIESSSFKYGWGHDTVVDMDVLISSGQVLPCSATNKNQELFHAMPNSYGVLGYITRVKLALIPSKKYVLTVNLKFDNAKDAFSFIKKKIDNKYVYKETLKVDFIDCVAFSKDEIYVVLGFLTDHLSGTLSNYPRDGLYYESIKTKPHDYFTIKDYYWRWDADMFWGVTGIPILTNKWIRKIFGRCLLNSRTLRAMQRIVNEIKPPSKNKEKIVQDLGVPHENAAEFFDWLVKEINIFPMWICPVVPRKSDTPLWSYNEEKLYFDIGVFGRKLSNENPKGYYNKKIERKLLELEGNKCFYSETYFDKDQFKSVINNEKYELLKKKYDRQNRFGDLYSKVINQD